MLYNFCIRLVYLAQLYYLSCRLVVFCYYGLWVFVLVYFFVLLLIWDLGMYFLVVFFFFNVTATTLIYNLSLHDALAICYVVG